MNLNANLALDPKKRTYADVLKYFRDYVIQESIYGSNIFNVLVRPAELKAKKCSQRSLGAQLIPRHDISHQIQQMQAELNSSRGSQRSYSIDSDDYSLALSQMYQNEQFKDPLNIAGLFLASWFAKVPVQQLHVGTVVSTQRRWGLDCPILRSMVDLSVEHTQFLGVNPVPKGHLPIPSMGQYIACGSLQEFVRQLAFYFAVISDRFAVVPVTLIPEEGVVSSRAIDIRSDFPVNRSPALAKEIDGYTESTKPAKPAVASENRPNDESSFHRRSMVRAILKRIGIAEIPERVLNIVDEGKSVLALRPQDVEALLWTMPKSELSKYLQFGSQVFRNYIIDNELVQPNAVYFDAVRNGIAPYKAEPVPQYSLEPGQISNSRRAEIMQPFMLDLVRLYGGEKPHKTIQKFMDKRCKISEWTDNEMLELAWLLPIDKLHYISTNKQPTIVSAYSSRNIAPLPPKGYWDQVQSGQLPYPNGIPHDPTQAGIAKLSQAKQTLHKQLANEMEPYTSVIPDSITDVLKNDYSHESVPMDLLEQLIWTMPFTQLLTLFDTSAYKLNKRLKEDGLVRPIHGFWLQVNNGKQAYPNGQPVPEFDPRAIDDLKGFEYDTSKLSKEQLYFLRDAQIKLRQYTEALPEVFYTASIEKWKLRTLNKSQLTTLLWSSPPKLISNLLNTTVYKVQVRTKELSLKAPASFFWDNVRKGEISYPAGKVNKEFIA